MKKVLIGVVILLVLVVGFIIWRSSISPESQVNELPEDYRSVTFFVSGVPVTLVDGVAEVRTDLGGSSLTTIRYFGNEVRHDLDGDGTEDIAFLITQDTGGSGTFFYLVGALARENGYQGTHAVYIGDRIAPQTTTPGEGRQIVVNYATRAPDEPFTTTPSIGKSLYLLLDVDTLEFGEVVQDFEGEAR